MWEHLHPSDVWFELSEELSVKHLGRSWRKDAGFSAEVAALSKLYTQRRDAIEEAERWLRAQLGFFMLRDLPKVEPALDFLAVRGLLPRGSRWRVADLGAGCGTLSLGLARWARRHKVPCVLEVLALDRSAKALGIFEGFARETQPPGRLEKECVPIVLIKKLCDLEMEPIEALVRGREIVFAGFVLNELRAFPSLSSEARLGDRLEHAAEWVACALGAMADGGLFIAIEPALRETSRFLQRLRGLIIERGFDVPYPCAHLGPCPLLERERDWCHAELPLKLPEPLRPIARQAGLRFEGLSHSVLVIRKGEPRPGDPLEATLVGGPIPMKGKVELHLCHAKGLTRVDWLWRDGDVPPFHRGSRVRTNRPLEGQRMRAVRDVQIGPGIALEGIKDDTFEAPP
ncbi:MAG: small ribosomal subunit Rsm22 family protein [Sandaracinaceae bacterium]|nr:small ribosomal subunit Rsm22 family protein [Sandaracinaceae bacterium]